jgi:3-oxoacyl-[acyl-carrier-protein] synthase II
MAAPPPRRVVITGIGVLSPIGHAPAPFWQSLLAKKSGVRTIRSIDTSALPVHIAGEIDFKANDYVEKKDRKSLKMMARTIQMGLAGANMAMKDCGIDRSQLDSTRFGVEFGSGLVATELDDIAPAAEISGTDQPGVVDMAKWGGVGIRNMTPLWMLKYLPNMVACHVSIVHDAQGPNNSITETDVASLLAVGEAYRILKRNQADFFLAGAADSKLTPLSLVRQCLFTPLSRRNDDPAGACRPFDRGRDGEVIGEGAGVLVVEALDHARRRGASIYAEIAGFGCSFDRRVTGDGIVRAMRTALDQAGIGPNDIDHVNAHGVGTVPGDAWEAKGICAAFGDRPVPVFAAKSFIGNLSSAGSTVELIASLLALRHGTLPGTLNFAEPDPACPIAVSADPRPVTKPYALKLSLTDAGQCSALVVRRWED